MKTKIFLCAFIASMFFFASCTKDEEEQLQSDILGTWVNMNNFSEGGVLRVPSSSYDSHYCEYIVISKGAYEYHTHEAEKTDYITFKNGVLDISQSGKWDTYKYEYSIHENDLFLAGWWEGTLEVSSNRMLIKYDDEIEVYERVKQVIAPGTVNLKSISFDKESVSIGIGEVLSFAALIPGGTNLDYHSIQWASSDESIARVSSGGVIGKSAGTAVITATVGGKSASCVVTVSFIPVSSVSLDRSTLSLGRFSSKTLKATVSPSNATVQTVTWSSSDVSVATVSLYGVVSAIKIGTATITATVGEKNSSCVVTVTKYTAPVGEAVDLGLSVKWANFNVGASEPEEYGLYFAWGETEPKSDYSWFTYKYFNGDFVLTKYCTNSRYGYNGFTDNKTVLDPEDDAAHVNWGGNWRMPTKEEWYELLNNCTWTWTTLNGVNGYKVQSQKSGYTDNWIFLPAAGVHYDLYLDDVGYVGFYWSSSLDKDYPYCAYPLYFTSSDVNRDYYPRYYGQSVRPVCP